MRVFFVNAVDRIQRALVARSARLALVLVTSAAYATAYLPLRALVGEAAGLLAIVPVLLCGWFFGLPGGLLAGLMTPLLNTLLLNTAGHPGWAVILRENAGLGALAAIGVGAIVGHWSDLARALRQQIAEQRRVQMEAQEGLERFRRLVEASTEGIAIVDGARIVDANPALAAMFGYDLSQMLGQNALMFAALQAREQVAQHVLSGIETPYEALGLRRDGTTFPAEIVGRTIRYEGRTARVTIIHDLTDRRRAEAALRESEQRYHALWQAAKRQTQELTLLDQVRQALVHELDLPMVIKTVVEGIAQTFGYSLVSLYLMEGEELHLKHQVGYARVIERVAIGEGVSGRVVRTGQPVLLGDVRCDPAFLGAIEGITSEVCVPLFDQGQVVGVLNVEGTQGVILTEADLGLMVSLSEQVGIALGRARLAAEVRESQRRFESAFAYAAIGMALVLPDGRWLQVNRALCELVGYTEAELLATSFQAITHPDDRETDLGHIRQMLAGEIQTYQMEKRYFHRRGHVVWVLLSVSLVRDSQEHPLCFISQIQDVSHRKAAEAALRDSEARYRSLFENVLEGYAYCRMIVDQSGRPVDFVYIDANHAYEALIGLENVTGRRMSEVMPAIREANPEVFETYGRVALTRKPERHERYLASLRLWVTLAVYSPRPGHLVIVLDNITQRKQAEEALRESEARYRGLFEDSPISLWEEDFSAVKARIEQLRQEGVTDFRGYLQAHPGVVAECVAKVLITDVNGATLKLFRATSKADLLTHLDRIFVSESYDDFVEELVNIAERQTEFEREAVNHSLAGERLEVSLHWAAARGHEDTLSKVIVSLLDITERKQAKQALEQANARLEHWLGESEQRTHDLALLNELGTLLQDCRTADDAYTVIAQVMPSLFPEMAGRLSILDPSGDWVAPVAYWGGDEAAEPFAAEDCWALRHRQLHVAVGEESGAETAIDPVRICPHAAGLPLALSVCAPLSAQEKILGVLHLYRPRTQGSPESDRAARIAWPEARQQFARTVADSLALSLTNLNLQETLRQQAIRDPLTGLLNRRYLEETFEREVARVTRGVRPLGVIMLDLDHFKHFNDTFGHAAGDALLEALGALLKSSVRGEDIACRYGGEEFLLILPEAPLGVTQARANRLREAVKQLKVRHDGQSLQPATVSIGVAEFPQHGRTHMAVLRAADQALYRAKRAGRDRVSVAEPVPSDPL